MPMAGWSFCNQRFIDMFGLSDKIVKPGCYFRDLIQHRKDNGTFNRRCRRILHVVLADRVEGPVHDTLLTTPDGRSIRSSFRDRGTAAGPRRSRTSPIANVRKSASPILRITDALTDLPNRVMFRERLEAEIATLHDGARFAILYIDIDEFKSVNDTLGHAIGDELLENRGHAAAQLCR